MLSENYKDYISPKHAIGSRKTRGTDAVILGKLQMTGSAYEDHRPNITSPVWPGAPTRRSVFATAGGLCYASSGSDSPDSTRFPAVANVLVVDAEDAFSRREESIRTRISLEELSARIIAGGQDRRRNESPRRCTGMETKKGNSNDG